MDRREFLSRAAALSAAGVFGADALLAAAEKLKRSDVPARGAPYADTLAAQLEQVADDPLVQRFKRARAALKQGPFYPQYHFLAPENNIGDPNGLCYWHGRWHLFYQFRPREEPQMAHWGHAYSDDLMHWQDLPIALYPEPGAPHVSQCFSGSALAERDRVLAIYHATGKGNMVASSSDPLLLNWQRIRKEGSAVTIPAHPQQDAQGNPYRAWDPFLFRDGGVYYSISGIFMGNQQDNHLRRAVWHLFTSKDLLNWEYCGRLLENDPFTELGDDGSCSYLWPLSNGKHLLIFFSHRSGSQHLLGVYDKQRGRFVPEAHQLHRTGPASAAPDPQHDGAIIVIQNKAGGMKSLIGDWNNVFTLPKRFSLGPRGIVRVEPAGDSASLRRDKVALDRRPLAPGQETALHAVSGKALEIEAVIEPGGSSLVEINVLRSPEAAEYTSVKLHRCGEPYDRRGGQRWTLSIDTARSSLRPEVAHCVPDTMEFLRFDDEPLRVRLFIDISVVEAYANEQASLIGRAYPRRDDSVGVAVRASGRGAALASLTAWRMNSI